MGFAHRCGGENFQWIGALLRDIRICYAWGATGIRSWDDMMARKEFLIGTTARGSNAYVNGAILRKQLRQELARRFEEASVVPHQ